MFSDRTKKEKLLLLINKKRKEMIDVAEQSGIKSDQTVQHSQELDKLLVEYQKLLIL